MTKTVFVPRFFDAGSHNAQNLNAKAILSHFDTLPGLTLRGVYHDKPIDIKRRVKLTRLWRGRFLRLHMILLYQGRYDAIFYPGKESFDKVGLFLRKITGRSIPVIATLEGIAGDVDRERELKELVGHQVHCNRMPSAQLRNFDLIRHWADHVIAISPFLATIGRHLFGDKFSVIPLGVDPAIFYCDESVEKNDRVTVVCSGTVYARKRPGLFIELAKRLPDVKFVWYGVGELLEQKRQRAEKECYGNIEFAGLVNHNQLAESFRKADLFVLPALSEGVPKVSQEAAACGLPLILFGHYEAPTVEHGKNGYVVWNDEEFFQSVASLVSDREKMKQMGQRSADMAKKWSWEQVAQKWESELHRILFRTH